MLEMDRQVVIFGNFNVITFNSIEQLNIIAKKYSLQFGAQPDIVLPQSKDFVQPIMLSQNQMSIPLPRPVLNSSDGKIIVFLGSSRIHVEQKDADSNSFEEFKSMAIDIICQLLTLFNVSVNRVALNGQFSSGDAGIIDKLFDSVFKKSELYNSSSKEWQFRINTVEVDNKLGCELNKIITSSCVPVVSREGGLNIILQKMYDYNTRVENNKIFSIEEIKTFIDTATKYREKVLEEMV